MRRRRSTHAARTLASISASMPSQSEPPAEAGMVQYYPGALGALQWSAGCVRLRLPLARLGANVEIQISVLLKRCAAWK